MYLNTARYHFSDIHAIASTTEQAPLGKNPQFPSIQGKYEFWIEPNNGFPKWD